MRAADLGQLSAVVPPLVILVLLVGASQQASELSVVTIQRLYLALSRRYLDELLQAVTRLSPQQLARAEMSARIQGAAAGKVWVSHLTVFADVCLDE